jgi:hypothetical protein
MTATIDMTLLEQHVRSALGLLRQSYSQSEAGGGGWYHQLEKDDPGATATALGLMTLHSCHERFEHFDDALTFLKARQVESTDPLVDGGWATNTSLGHPVVEATGWVALMIGRTGRTLHKGPDARRVLNWLINNQNTDGGWGSLRGCPSRVWLTCVALRGLAQLNPYDAAIVRGVEWLVSHRNTDVYAWGEQAALPTVTHTAFVLLTLAELQAEGHDELIRRAYDWLEKNLNTESLDDPNARMETYRVTFSGTGNQNVRLALWHYGLPVALTALLRHPNGPPGKLINSAFATIGSSQLKQGYWPNFQGGHSISLWGIWWCLEALTDIKRLSYVRPGDLLVLLEGGVILQRAELRDQPITSMLPANRGLNVRRLLTRHWATLILVLFAIVALLAVALDLLSWQEFAVGLVLPIALFAIEQSRRLSRDN